MKVNITAIREPGNLEKERIVIRVDSSCNIGEFILLQTGFENESVNTGIYETFWFPDKSVRAGDLVVVYTKTGKSSEKKSNDATSHFFYMGKAVSIWNRNEQSAVLMHAPEWQSFQAVL
ncbi:TPA: hypothetical protein PBQ56_002484 [Escherichia coli]|uniref:hypothetical protein n=1 Tax=Enterobacteriaceae TaxID=543 RepID=UPI0006A5CB05|nr:MULTISPECIES: hypothetical protein [Enterobacteriaceae]ELK6070740.1 hypothetical protein [Citrobacter freundii]AWJ05717.1 hypothetical protein DEP49_15865 [Escherichia coli]EEU9510656.1 hypothetical protein [Escherichia coli]EEY9448758.1 hypothetical protein [Escherichia coli]EFN7857016.1 hypothetical protein [Escherichia coli]